MRTIFVLCFIILSSPALAQFKTESEAGVVITGGNAKTQSYNVQNKSEYSAAMNVYKITGSYLAAKQRDVESAEKWNLGLRYERELSSKVNGFVSQSVDGDKFAGILQRYNSDLGAKYYLQKSENGMIWFVEVGYRFTRQHSTNDVTDDYQKGRLYTEIERQWALTTSTKFWVEYLPNFTFSEGWLLNAEASVSSALSSIFSVKTAYLVNYNNSPSVSTAGRTDTTFTTSLVARF